jgi:predicted DNA-binding protein
MKEAKVIVSTQIPESWDESLKQEAKRLRVTKSTVIREAISGKIEEIEESAEGEELQPEEAP